MPQPSSPPSGLVTVGIRGGPYSKGRSKGMCQSYGCGLGGGSTWQPHRRGKWVAQRLRGRALSGLWTGRTDQVSLPHVRNLWSSNQRINWKETCNPERVHHVPAFSSDSKTSARSQSGFGLALTKFMGPVSSHHHRHQRVEEQVVGSVSCGKNY